MAGQWLSIQNQLSDAASFYFGHQGYEYIDLGRVWQIALFVGLLLWLFLVVRVVRPALKQPGEQRHLLLLFLMSSTAIGLFYGAGPDLGPAHPSVDRGILALVGGSPVGGRLLRGLRHHRHRLLLHRLDLIRPALAAEASLLSATIFLAGGIIGTCHHLYFSGTPTVALAWGSVFSALEVVPLILVAYRALEDLRRRPAHRWAQRYKWPIYFFVAVAFWNMVGAGLFGFMINPPIALYYMQGLNTTPLHAHAALFGVYGMLGIGLMLMCLRAMLPDAVWKEGLLKFAFWAMNIGLMAMCVLSLLAGRADADLGLGGEGLLVRPQSRVPAHRRHADAALAARAGRHDLRRRRTDPGRLGLHHTYRQAGPRSRWPRPRPGSPRTSGQGLTDETWRWGWEPLHPHRPGRAACEPLGSVTHLRLSQTERGAAARLRR